jgi:hypothetical protein
MDLELARKWLVDVKEDTCETSVAAAVAVGRKQ